VEFFYVQSTLLLPFVAAEICRLRWNWLYLILLVCLDAINSNSPLPSLHQFVTNPTAQQLNGTGRGNKAIATIVFLITVALQ